MTIEYVGCMGHKHNTPKSLFSNIISFLCVCVNYSIDCDIMFHIVKWGKSSWVNLDLQCVLNVYFYAMLTFKNL